MFSLVGAEVPHLVLLDRAAEGSTVLLVGERRYLVDDGVGRIEGVVTEVAEDGAVNVIAACLGLDVHVHARRTTQRGVEAVGDDLELRDGIR